MMMLAREWRVQIMFVTLTFHIYSTSCFQLAHTKIKLAVAPYRRLPASAGSLAFACQTLANPSKSSFPVSPRDDEHKNHSSSMTTAATPTATPIAAGSVATRPAAVSDVERLYPIINTAYRSDKNWTNESELVAGERITADELRAQIETQVDPILVAELDGQVIGCIQLECTCSVCVCVCMRQ